MFVYSLPRDTGSTSSTASTACPETAEPVCECVAADPADPETAEPVCARGAADPADPETAAAAETTTEVCVCVLCYLMFQLSLLYVYCPDAFQ